MLGNVKDNTFLGQLFSFLPGEKKSSIIKYNKELQGKVNH